MIDKPPFDGALHDTLAPVVPCKTASGAPGAAGTVAGTNAFDGPDSPLVPTALVAVAVHWYVPPFVRPDTEIGEVAEDAEPEAPPPDDVHDTVY